MSSTSQVKYCPHCDKRVHRATCYHHRRWFFDPESQVWNCLPGVQTVPCEAPCEDWMNQIEDCVQEKCNAEETWDPNMAEDEIDSCEEANVFDCGSPGRLYTTGSHCSILFKNYLQIFYLQK